MTKNTKPVRGRPKLPDNEKRSVLMQFHVNESDAKAIQKAAKGDDQSVSDWLREHATDAI